MERGCNIKLINPNLLRINFIIMISEQINIYLSLEKNQEKKCLKIQLCM
jgi:hypothetical protein